MKKKLGKLLIREKRNKSRDKKKENKKIKENKETGKNVYTRVECSSKDELHNSCTNCVNKLAR